MDAAQRFTAELGYGFEGAKRGALWAPFLAAEAGERGRSVRLGVKLDSGPNLEAALELGQLRQLSREPENAVEQGRDPVLAGRGTTTGPTRQAVDAYRVAAVSGAAADDRRAPGERAGPCTRLREAGLRARSGATSPGAAEQEIQPC